ncbi:polygalacturonase-like [Chenopodium quinoa]|uniref:polygalacturonase-like n=1 Tax=Chenopodium quinoa TaxID=63459 RepID=UPI000B7866F0|nr:polygalacturonase-like [Chenopodium quinoa]
MGPIDFHNAGFLKAHKVNIGLTYWVEFRYVDKLGITGSGHFDGQGSDSWFKIMEDNPSINNLPTVNYLGIRGNIIDCLIVVLQSLMLTFVNNSRINNMNFVDSKGSHIKLFGCKNVTITQIHVSAPPNSPNTDGINIAFSRQIQVSDSKISTGDDCISLLPGAEDVNITGTRCGPGHGISIGSMGFGPNELAVKGINVKNCNFTDTMNGVRIKTWATKNAGKVAQVSFESIFVNNASNPIIIDQNYCPSHKCPKVIPHLFIFNRIVLTLLFETGSYFISSGERIGNIWEYLVECILIPQKKKKLKKKERMYSNSLVFSLLKGDSHVQISDVKFVNIMGVSQTYVAVNLQCSKYRPCEVEIENINLRYGSNKGPTISSCYNVKGVASGFQKPPSCIS